VTRTRPRLLIAVVTALPVALLLVATWFGVGLPLRHISVADDGSSGQGLNLGHAGYLPLRSAFVAGRTGLSFGSNRGGAGSAGNGVPGVVAAPFATQGTAVTLARPTNSTFAGAYPIASLPFTARENTRGVGREQGDPKSCQATGGAVWFRYRPAHDQTVTVSTFGSSYTAYTAVFSGDSLDNLTAVPNSCGTGAVSGIALKGGQSYFVQVVGPLGGGDLIFRVTRSQPPGRMAIASESTDGRQSMYFSDGESLSTNGRYVAFTSGDPDLARPFDAREAEAPATGCQGEPNPGRVNDDPSHPDRAQVQPSCLYVYWRDLRKGITRFVVNAYEVSISGNGRYVAFATSGNLLNLHRGCTSCQHVYVRDMKSGRFILADPSLHGGLSTGSSWQPQLSANGRYVGYSSDASDLSRAYGGGGNQAYRYDLRTRRVELITRNAAGQPQDNGGDRGIDAVPTLYCLSATGRYAVVYTPASNLVRGDTNGVDDVFRVDMKTHQVVRVDVPAGGGQTSTASVAPSWTQSHCISDDGRYVAFASPANNLVPGLSGKVYNTFVRDVVAGTTEIVSVSSAGQPANSSSGSCLLVEVLASLGRPAPSIPGIGQYECGVSYDTPGAVSISADGRYVAFDSLATNLAPGATSGISNVYRHDRLTGETILVSAASGKDGPAVPDDSEDVAMSANGRRVVFHSWENDLVPGQRTVTKQVFMCTYPRPSS
jgi:Tol biopolymer transport system component